jgi:hypothetical protein
VGADDGTNDGTDDERRACRRRWVGVLGAMELTDEGDVALVADELVAMLPWPRLAPFPLLSVEVLTSPAARGSTG